MLKIALLTAIIAVLVACNSNPAPPTTATQPPSAAPATTPVATPTASASTSSAIEPKLQELAGKDAKNCGDVKTLSGPELSGASDCAMQAAKAKKAFVVSYEMPGLSVGVAGNDEGKLFTVQTSEQAGKAMPPSSMPCPSELRLANSGRVTCMPAGSMGVAPGSGNPHAGGITTSAGAPSPHGASKSH